MLLEMASAVTIGKGKYGIPGDNQSILYLDTCRPGARKLVRNTNVGYKILHGKIYIKIRKQYKRNLAIITSQKLYIHYE